MARKCKCFVTGEIGTTDVFYKPNNKVDNISDNTKYFKSKEVYEQYRYQKDLRLKIMKELGDLMGYITVKDGGSSQSYPTVITRKLKDLAFYGDEVILETIYECSDSIKWSFSNKEFSNEYGKASYMMSIIVNNINDIYKRKKQLTRQAVKEDKTEIVENVDVYSIGNKSKARDISSWLTEEDL